MMVGLRRVVEEWEFSVRCWSWIQSLCSLGFSFCFLSHESSLFLFELRAPPAPLGTHNNNNQQPTAATQPKATAIISYEYIIEAVSLSQEATFITHKKDVHQKEGGRRRVGLVAVGANPAASRLGIAPTAYPSMASHTRSSMGDHCLVLFGNYHGSYR